MLGPGITAVDVHVIQIDASDHYPVVADLEVSAGR